MAVTISGYPTGGMKYAYKLPWSDSMRIEFQKEMRYENFDIILHLFIIDIPSQGPHNYFSHDTITVNEKEHWNINLFGSGLEKRDIVMQSRTEVIQKLYDRFCLRMCIGPSNTEARDFFFNAAYNTLFFHADRPPNTSIKITEKKPEPVDNTPPEVKSALHLHEKGIKLQKKIYQDTVEFQKEVSEHYKKYGTLGQRFIEYIKSFIPKL